VRWSPSGAVVTPGAAVGRDQQISGGCAAGPPGCLTRHSTANYDFAELGWPMQWDFQFDTDGSRETVYFLGPEQAKRWRRVRAG
jgi:hypothetical protein